MTKRELHLEGGAPWGFRMNGGADTGHPLRISRVNPGSKAAQQGVREGDVISAINGTPTRLLSNGESHALLRSAGPTLTLGLNQDCTGSPKRRSRDSAKRSESGSGTQETKTQTDSVTQAQIKTVADTTACTSNSQPNKQGKKTKHRRQKNTQDEIVNSKESDCVENENSVFGKEEIQTGIEIQTSQKMSSSRARRLRKARLKNKMKEDSEVDLLEETTNCNDYKDLSSSSVVAVDMQADTAMTSPENKHQNIVEELLVVNFNEPSPILLTNSNTNKTNSNLLEESKSSNSKKKKDKRKNKSDNSKMPATELPSRESVLSSSSNCRKQNKINKKSDDLVESTSNLAKSFESKVNVSEKIKNESVINTEVKNITSKGILQKKTSSNEKMEVVPHCTKETVKIVDNSSIINYNSNLEKKENVPKDGPRSNVITKSVTNFESKDISQENFPYENVINMAPVCKKEIVKIVETSKREDRKILNKIDAVENSFAKETVKGDNIYNSESKTDTRKLNENTNLPLNRKEIPAVMDSDTINNNIKNNNNQFDESKSLPENEEPVKCDNNRPRSLTSEIESSVEINTLDSDLFKLYQEKCETGSEFKDTPFIEVFINPPTPTKGVENTFFDPNWENVEEMETSSGPVSSDESDVHQEYFIHFPPNDLQAQIPSPSSVDDGVDEYDLTVQDIRNPLIPPEEEEKLRCFLETLELTKPEEYDDSSSNKSSEEAVVTTEPECYATKQEIVVYKHCKKRCVAEPCYIPSPHRNYLDVITEENSDSSDNDRKSEERPWEDPEVIRRNNEFDSIPDDWIDSDNEVEYGYDDGGIKSWSEGTTLDEAEGVEIIYLDSDTSDDTVGKEPELDVKPQLVVVQTKEINKVLSVETSENNAVDNCDMNVCIKMKNTNDVVQSEICKNKMSAVNSAIENIETAAEEKAIQSTFNTNPININSIDHNGGGEHKNHNSAVDNNLSINSNSVKQPVPSEYDTNSSGAINNLYTLDLIKRGSKHSRINFDDEIKEVSEFESLFNSLTSKKYTDKPISSKTLPMNKKNSDNSSSAIEVDFPVPQEKLDVSVTPALSRQNSSGSGTPTTQSTTRCTTSQSPIFYETEDKTNSKNTINTCIELQLNPESLKELSAKRVISLPNGIRLLEEVGIIRFQSENVDYDKKHEYYEDRYFSPRNISRRSSTLPESPMETRPTSRPLSLGSCSLANDFYSPRSSSVLMFTPPSSNVNSPPYSIPPDNDDQWRSMQTSEENLRLCLSPSQCKSRTLPASPKEAAGLLDLHKKFIQRRGYHEDKRRYSNENLPSPDLIQLEHCNEMRKPQDYTPELLTEAANLLALKEYRQSRFTENRPKSKQEIEENLCENFNQTLDELSAINHAKPKEIIKENIKLCDSVTKTIKGGKEGNYSTVEKESKRKGRVFDSDFRCKIPASSEIFSDTKGGESEVEESSKRGELDRVLEPSDGSRLLALIQSQIYPAAKAHCPIATTALCDPPFDRSGEETGKKYTGSGDFVSGWLTMSRNVTESEGKRVFDADQYRISKQGDIAVMLSPDAKRPERPKSLPSSVSSGGEIFRKQMYNEYMDKVAERYERRQQKVIKISDRPASMFVSKDELKDVTIPSEVPKLEDEFMNKVKERMNKLGISLEDDDTKDVGEIDEPQLPKHLQEFVQLTSESPQNGVWSPVQTPEAQRKKFDFASAQKEREEEEEKKKEEDDQAPVVWTPRTAPSPPVEKKTFRPVNFESPPPVRKNYQPVNEEAPKPPTSLPLTPSDWSHKDKLDKTIVSESIETHRRLTSSQSAESSLAASAENTLPKAPNPTITLLQKAREGQLPRGAHYLDEEEENPRVDKPEEKRLVEPNEIIYTITREYSTESEDKKPKKFVDLGPRKFEGIGPTTKEGIPIVLRSEVKDANQQKWYKRMYDSLHRAEKDREFVTVRYKPNRRGYPYSSGGGYLSEPDRLGTDYDSDAITSKYATLDRRRIRNKENDFTTSTMPRSKYVSNNSVKNAVDVYKNQPGRIEDYEPGRSSISEKEAKQWWDEVLDIFDEQFEQSQKSSRPPPTTPNTGKPFMTYALKESGYESDSQLVFKRRDENLQNQLAMSPAEQKIAYKTIQKGGEVPLHGLRKPAPERPKEPISGGAIPVPERDFHSKQQRPESPHRYVESEVTIHYRSPVRSEAKEAWSEEELARRQAEAMRRIYQEERRRKYLQELQDMYSRRHTDNFIPSQKSPIPLNRYDDFLDDVSPTKPRDHTPEPKLVARALYNFVGQSSRELTFRRGDVIFVRRQIDKNWYEGEHNAMIGLFPINYVEIIPYDGIRTTPKRPSEGQARAKFNFQAQTHLELSLVKGELVVLTRRVDDNWFEGRIGSRKGIFPVSYVEILVEPGDRTVSPVRPTTPASNKPVASPAAHSLMLNGGKNSLSHHHYQPPPPVNYTSLTRSTKTIKSDLAPVNQALHIDTQSEPVPYRALYNYKPQNDDELELNEGDTVYVMEKCDDGWYVGSSQRTGCFGTFPGNYVQRLSRGH